MYSDAELDYEVRTDLLQEKRKLVKRIGEIDYRLKTLQEHCNHEIVFMFGDSTPHKIGEVNCCFCPTCNKIEIIHQANGINNTSFRDSRVIDMHEVDYFEKPFSIVSEELFTNYDGYLRKSDDEVKKRMIEVIRGRQKRVE
ncbi:MAG: hypothetical protein IKQ35_03970 [Bacilli bacterium]|nr:hypothetical protein [Bacilli bacterium]